MVFNDADFVKITQILDGIENTEPSMIDAGLKLSKIEVASDATEAVGSIAFALTCVYINMGDERRGVFGAYAPMLKSRSATSNLFEDSITDGSVDIWEDLLTWEIPIVLEARLYDFLWLAKSGSEPHNHAVRAIEAFCKCADAAKGTLTAEKAVNRAWDLSMLISSETNKAQIINLAIATIETAIKSGKSHAGVVLRLFEFLTSTVKVSSDPRLQSLLDLAIVKYKEIVQLYSAALDAKAATMPSAERDEIYLIKVNTLLEYAREAEGIDQIGRYRVALDTSNLHQFTELSRQIRSEIENLPDVKDSMQLIQVEQSIDRQEIKDMYDKVIGDDDLSGALMRFAWFGVSDSYADDETLARQIMSDSPLRFLMTHVVTGEYNSVIREISDEDAHLRSQIIQHETTRISLYKNFRLELFPLLRGKYSITTEALQEYLATSALDETVQSAIVRSYRLYLSGEFDAASHLLIPRIERAIRSLAFLGGVVITKGPIGSKPGGVRGLGEILEDMQEVFSEHVYRFFKNVLTEVLSINLRNKTSHGLIDECDESDYLLLLQVSLLLARIAGAR